MKKTSGRSRLILLAIVIAVLFISSAAAGAVLTGSRVRAAAEKRRNMSFGELDYYSMNKYCGQNAKAVMYALRQGDTNELASLMVTSEGVRGVMDFADWRQADFDNAISMGSGTLTPEPDEEGRVDVSERFFVDVGGERYVLFIETLTSRWGRANEGVSAVGVTTFAHFDATDYEWNGEKDGKSELAGELFWTR